jgi:hypothetical protein
MNIVELLSLRGLDTNTKIKLVRHQDKRYDVRDLYRKGYFDIYQSYQGRHVFECEYVVSFVGWESSQARFVGVYRVKGSKPASEVPLPAGFPYPDFVVDGSIFYELEPVAGFDDLKDRIVIDWGKSPLAWHQWLTEKEVIEILPKGYIANFPGYLDFVITYDELVGIINNPTAHKEWHLLLSAVAGVYLIVDSKTGLQYVGSAYGEDGILGRWAEYTRHPHGGNDKLKALIADDESYASNFRFTILHTLPKTLTKNEVIKYEVRYKEKLGTKAFGLNSN